MCCQSVMNAERRRTPLAAGIFHCLSPPSESWDSLLAAETWTSMWSSEWHCTASLALAKSPVQWWAPQMTKRRGHTVKQLMVCWGDTSDSQWFFFISDLSISSSHGIRHVASLTGLQCSGLVALELRDTVITLVVWVVLCSQLGLHCCQAV